MPALPQRATQADRPSRQASRIVTRATAWPVASGDWPSFRTETHEIPVVGTEKGANGSLKTTPKPSDRTTMASIIDECVEYFPESIRLIHRLGTMPSGLRICGRASMIAAALCKLFYLYGQAGTVVRSVCYLDETDAPQFDIVRTRVPVINDVSAHQWHQVERVILEAEILGAFALILHHMSKSVFLEDIHWADLPEPAGFYPAWILHRRAEGAVLEIRPRSSWKAIRWLVARYQSRYLLES